MTIFDQGWLSFGGDPITGKAPTQVIVKAEPGVVMTPAQEGGVAHAYKLFCDTVKNSSFPGGYHVQNRVLLDGTTVRMESNNGVHRVMVRLFGKEEETELLRGFIAKLVNVVAVDGGFEYPVHVPTLLKYIADDAQWAVKKNNFKPGNSTGYYVVLTPDRLPEEPKPDVHFFDVAYNSEAGSLFVYWTDSKGVGAKRLLAESPTPTRVPVLLPNPAGGYGVGTDDEGDYHLFPLGAAGVSHVAGRTGTVDEDFLVETVLEPRMPPTVERIGVATFGYNPTTGNATLFGLSATYFGQPLNLYHWYAEIGLSRTEPHLVTHSITADPAPPRNYRSAFDLFEHASISTTSFDTPGPYPAGVPTSLAICDFFPTTYVITSTDIPAGINYWQGTEHYGGAVTGSLDPSGTHDSQRLVSSGAQRDETYYVGTQIGIGTLRHSSNVGVEYERIGSHVLFGYKSSPLSFPGISWVGMDNPDNIATATWGSSEMITRENLGVTAVNYTLTPPGSEAIPLYLLTASISYNQEEYTASMPAGVTTHAGDFEGAVGPIFPLYTSEDNPEKTWMRSYGLSSYATQHYSPESDLQYTEVRKAAVTCRDYLYHDIVNDTAIYVKSTGDSETGLWTMTLEVVARGVAHTIPLASAAGAEVNLTAMSESFVWGDPYEPMWLEPPANPACYTPVCEQGAFKCIAYTTAAEEALGVPKRFMLALPLSVYGRGMTPELPEHAYPFVLENFTEAQHALTGGMWADLLGHIFYVYISHDGERDWIVDLAIDGDAPPHFAHCYRV